MLRLIGCLAAFSIAGLSAEPAWSPCRAQEFVARLNWQSVPGAVGPARLALRSEDRTRTISLEILSDKLQLLVGPRKQEKIVWAETLTAPATGNREAWLRVRGGKLVLGLDGRRRTVSPAGLGPNPHWQWQPAGTCKLTRAPKLQPIAPIAFADDFMRDSGNQTLWDAIGGQWAIQASMTPSQSANAFRLYAKSRSPAFTISSLSYWFWSDYRFGASVKTGEPQGSVGLVFYYLNPKNYYSIQWSGEGRLQLVELRDGTARTIAEQRVGREPNNWYRLAAVVSGDTVAAYIDGTRQLSAKSDRLLGGKVGLLVHSEEGVWFDDIQVASVHQLPGEQLAHPLGPAETRVAELTGKTFSDDRRMASWSHPRGQWGELSNGICWHNSRFFGDVSFEWTAPRYPSQEGEVILFADRTEGNRGYRLKWDRRGTTLLRHTTALVSTKTPAGGVSSVQFAITNGNLTASLNRARIAKTTDANPLPGGHAGAKLTPYAGHRLKQRDWRDTSRVTSSRYLTYAFDAAPTAWAAQSGDWGSINRWACVPMWSFFGGRGAGNAILWHKRRIRGDFDLEFAFAPMEGDTQRVHYTFPMTLNVAFGADGQSLGSGYNLVFGIHDLPSRLYRKEALVAENKSRVVPGIRLDWNWLYRAVTQAWQRVRIRRKGKTYEIHAAAFDHDGGELGLEKLFEFTDPNPLDGDRFGAWTWGRNGMAIARASVSFEESPGLSPPRPPLKLPAPTNGRLRVVNRASGGTLRAVIHQGPLRPEDQGFLRFRYRLPPKLQLGLFVRRRMEVAQFLFAGSDSYRVGAVPLGRIQTVSDGRWHDAAVNLREAIARACPDDPDLPLDEIFLASPLRTVQEIGGIGLNQAGAVYEVEALSFGPAELKLPSPPLPSPRVTVYGLNPLDDFETGLGQWRTFGGREGALLWRDPAGAKSGRYGLRLLNADVAGPAGAQITSAPFDVRLFPRVRFDYAFPTGLEINLLVQSGGSGFEVRATGTDATWPVIGWLPNVKTDGRWHSTEIDLEVMLRRHLPGEGPLWVNGLYLADSMRMGNPQGLIYRVDNFCRVPAVPSDTVTEFTLSIPAHEVTGFSHRFDATVGTEPTQHPTGQGPILRAKVPAGTKWLHVAARTKAGKWTPSTHLPLVVRPGLPSPAPPPKGATATEKDAPPAAPRVAYLPSDRLCFQDFEWDDDPDGLGTAMGSAGIRRAAWVLPSRTDGATGTGCIEIINLFRDDFFSAFLHEGAYDVRRYPRLAFHYKFDDANCSLNLTGLLNKEMFVVEWLTRCQPGGYFSPYVIGRAPVGIQDGNWHHVDIDLLKMVRDSGRDRSPVLPLVLEQINTWAMLGGTSRYRNPQGARLKIDNFCVYSSRGRAPAFQWKVPGSTGAKLRYAYSLDRSAKTIPPTINTQSPLAEFKDVAPGRWYFHLRAQDAKNRWSPVTHHAFDIADQ